MNNYAIAGAILLFLFIVLMAFIGCAIVFRPEEINLGTWTWKRKPRPAKPKPIPKHLYLMYRVIERQREEEWEEEQIRKMKNEYKRKI